MPDLFKKLPYLIFLFFIIYKNGYSQKGDHFNINYLPRVYNSGANNFAITQNENGLIFVANDNGILIYDGGKNWQICKRSDEVTITYIARTPENKIVYGCVDGDFGELEKNSKGKFYLNSFKQNLNEINQPTEPIRQIINLNGKVYFLSSDKLIEYSNSKFQIYTPTKKFHTRALVMGKHLFLVDVDNTILVLQNGVLNSLPNTTELSNFKPFFCLPLSNREFAIGIRDEGFYKANYDSLNPTKTSFIKINSPSNKELQDAEFNSGLVLKNGNFVITTNKKGVFVLNKKLEIIEKFNSKNGLNDDNVKSVYEDFNGNLWFPLYYGISYLETNSSLYKYTKSNNIKGPVQSACYYNNQLYIATDKGVQYFNESSQSFIDLLEFDKQSWYLLNYDNKLYICTQKGIFIYNGKSIQQISEKNTHFIFNDPHQSNILYAALDDGVDVYTISGNNLTLIKSYFLNHKVQSIASDSTKNIYFGTTDNGIYFLNHSKANLIDSIQEADGLPSQIAENYLTTYKNKLLIGTGKGIFTVKPDAKGKYKCVKFPKFWELTKGSEIFRAAELNGDLICSKSFENKVTERIEQRTIYLSENKGKFSINNKGGISHLKDIKLNLISYDSSNRITFICTNEGLFLMNKQVELEPKKYNLYLSAFYAKRDTVLENLIAHDEKLKLKSIIDYKNNDVRFCLGYNCFEDIGNTEFSYYLEGKENEYSARDKKFEITYNNLTEGSYTLHLKAYNENTDDVLELTVPFKILPPWYRSFWAYTAYIILFILFLLIIIKLNSKRLVAKNIKLEEVIKQRTATIEDQVILLEHQKKEIIDSINYAQRIQRALLASKNLLDNYLSSNEKNREREYFVFFQPKDIVSGDFYWASNLVDNNFAIAIADSTGHGVPGAIMSMLNISCLKEAVIAQKLTQPNEILNYTRTKIIETLSNDGSLDGGKDGMDCSLLCFDFKKRLLCYAAANNPIWIIRKKNNSNELEFVELRADKMPVGKHERDNISFTQQTIQLQSGDMVYAFTDGLPDQFGGHKGKKFMYKQFKEVLFSISQLPSKEQSKILNEKFNDWKGTLEQVDDVLVFGIKIY